MRAIQIDNYGGPEALKVRQTADPAPGKGQVLIHILATSFNPIDEKRATGKMGDMFKPTFPWTPGGDFSGTIEKVGDGVERLKVGDEVWGYSMSGGAYADYITVDQSVVAQKPTSLSQVETASLALVAQTAYQALEPLDLKPGETVLIHGASGAVGGVAVQLAHLRGVKVIASGTQDSLERLKSAGADEAFDYRTTPFESVAHDVDAVLDTVGGDVQQRSFGVLKRGGRLASITQPPSPEKAEESGITATMVATKPSADLLNLLAEKVDSGQIVPNVDRTFPLADAAEAWKYVQSNPGRGKVVLVP